MRPPGPEHRARLTANAARLCYLEPALLRDYSVEAEPDLWALAVRELRTRLSAANQPVRDEDAPVTYWQGAFTEYAYSAYSRTTMYPTEYSQLATRAILLQDEESGIPRRYRTRALGSSGVHVHPEGAELRLFEHIVGSLQLALDEGEEVLETRLFPLSDLLDVIAKGDAYQFKGALRSSLISAQAIDAAMDPFRESLEGEGPQPGRARKALIHELASFLVRGMAEERLTLGILLRRLREERPFGLSAEDMPESDWKRLSLLAPGWISARAPQDD